MTLADDVDLEEFITAKDDLSGADIKAVCTEAGLLALRERRMRVTKSDVSAAREKVRCLYSPLRRTLTIPPGLVQEERGRPGGLIFVTFCYFPTYCICPGAIPLSITQQFYEWPANANSNEDTVKCAQGNPPFRRTTFLPPELPFRDSLARPNIQASQHSSELFSVHP